jgi:hypothetical protein
MTKKKAARASVEAASPKRLRRKLEKLEARQASASVKRDRAQARVDALAILADEVRAALAAAEAPTSEPDPAMAPPPPVPKARPATKPGAARKPATTRTRRTTRATGGRSTRTTSTRSTSARPRRRPSSGGAGSSGGPS